MKKVLLGLLFLATMSMSAQETESESPIKKGKIALGINVSDLVSNSNLNPSIDYVIQDNLILGVGLGINSSKSKRNDYYDIENKNYRIGVYGTKYFKVKNMMFFSLKGYVSYTSNFSDNNTQNGVDISNDVFRISLSPGLSYFINNQWAVDVNMLGLSYGIYDSNDSSVNSFGFNLNMSSLSLGIKYFL